nr:MAG TPA: hypothetical protein [Bacteriophage sp.]
MIYGLGSLPRRIFKNALKAFYLCLKLSTGFSTSLIFLLFLLKKYLKSIDFFIMICYNGITIKKQ